VRAFICRGFLAIATSAAALTGAPAAHADGGDLLMAEVLFRDGRDLLAHKDYVRACPKLAESYRLDPATGTLLALALCHEGQGKLASAWGEYVDAASRSRVERRPDRESAARARAADLGSKYSTLTIVLGDGTAVPGLEIRRNGAVVAPAWLGTAIPVDGGTITVDAAAPGHPSWRIQVAIAGVGDHQTLVVPSLDAPAAPVRTPAPPAAPTPAPRAVATPAPAPEPPPSETVAAAPPPATPFMPPPSAAPVTSPTEAPSPPLATPGFVGHRGLTPLQVGGVVLTAVGVAGAGVGAAFGIVAMQKNHDSHSQCVGDLCTDAGKQSRKDAMTAGNVATAAIIAGPVVAAVGVALIVLGRHGEAPATPASIQALPMVGPGIVGGTLGGVF
jgi:hypothetical protein